MRTRARSKAYITAINLAGEGLLWPLIAVLVILCVIGTIVFWSAIWSFIVLLVEIVFGIALVTGLCAILFMLLMEM